MDRVLSLWPAAWSRQQRSSATMLSASALMLLILWLIPIPLSWAPEPIGNNAQLFAEGTRVTVQLTIVSGVIGVILGVLAALGKVSRFAPLRWIVDRCLSILVRAQTSPPEELAALEAEVAELGAVLRRRFGAKPPVVVH